MGRRNAHPGVEARETSIRLSFKWREKWRKETLEGLPPTPANLKYAARIKQEIDDKISRGLFEYADYFPNSPTAKALAGASTSQAPLVRTVAADYLKIKAAETADSTLRSYKKALNTHFLPTFGERLISEVTYSELALHLADFKPLRRSRDEDLDEDDEADAGSAKTFNNFLVPLRGLFAYAKAAGYRDDNPAALLKNRRYQKPEPDPLDREEVQLVLARMRARYDAQVVNLFQFAFATGMRTSELLALQWGDIDWRHETATVRRALVEGKLKRCTKTYQSRAVELTAMAQEALRAQKAHTLLKKDGFIFHSPLTGEPYANDQTMRQTFWYPTLKALGLRLRDCYQTRHTYATLALLAGANPQYVSRQMGHKNMKMLLEVYSKWIDGADKRREKNKIETYWNGEPFSPEISQEAGETGKKIGDSAA